MSDVHFIGISKLDSTKRQLEFAINIFFHSGDFVVIHTLASASKTVLIDLSKKQGIVSFTEEMMKLIKKDKQNFVRKKLNEAQNFFKHADRDPSTLLKFNPDLSEYTIWESIELYQKLTHEITPLMKSFRMFFYTKHTNVILEEKTRKEFEKANTIVGWKDRKQFLDLVKLFEKDLIK